MNEAYEKGRQRALNTINYRLGNTVYSPGQEEAAKAEALAWLNENRRKSGHRQISSVPQLWWRQNRKEWMADSDMFKRRNAAALKDQGLA